MPKSKKNKVVHLTQVKKKGKDHKEDLIRQLEQYIAKFKRVYIFDFEQAKSDRIMNLRLLLKEHGNIFSGKNSLVTLTLKTIGAKENRNYDNLIQQVTGHRGLLFTDIKKDELIGLLDSRQPEFCKKLLGYADLEPRGASARKSKLAKGSASEAEEASGAKKKKGSLKKRDKDLAKESNEVNFVKI